MTAGSALATDAGPAPEARDPEPGTDAPTGPRRRPLLLVAGPGLVIGVLTSLRFLTRRSLWLDEAWSLGATNDQVATARFSGGAMSLYYAILRPWSLVSTDPRWLRSLSLLFALAALAGTVRLARRWMADRAAGLAGVLVGTSYLWATQAAEARGYALTLLLTVVSFSALDRIARPEGDGPVSARARTTFLLSWTLLPPTHGLAIVLLGGQAAALLLGGARRAQWKAFAPGAVAATVLTGGIYVAGARHASAWLEPTGATEVHRLFLGLLGAADGPSIVLAVVLLLGVVGLARRADRPGAERFARLAPLCWALVPTGLLLAGTVATPILVSRYLIVAVPGIALLLAAGVDALAETVAAPRRRAAWLGAALVVVTVSGATQVAVQVSTPDRWDRVVAVVDDHAAPGEVLLFPEPRMRVPYEAAWNAQHGRQLPVANFARPLGRVTYVEPVRSWPAVARQLDRIDGVWVVYKVAYHLSEGDRRAAIARLGDFRVAGTWELPSGITVTHYQRRAAAR